MTKRITLDIQEGDEAWRDALIKEIEDLCGMVHEAFVENRVILLSPVIRGIIADKAQSVKKGMDKVYGRIHIDNPGNPLNNTR
jgi:hypothetical protein